MHACRRHLAGAALGALLAVGAAPAWAQDAPARAPIPSQTPSSIPFKQDKASGGDLALRGAALLALSVLAAYGAALALKRFGLARRVLPGRERRVRLAESVRLSRRSVLHVVHYRGEELLLAESDHGLQLVGSHKEGAGDA